MAVEVELAEATEIMKKLKAGEVSSDSDHGGGGDDHVPVDEAGVAGEDENSQGGRQREHPLLMEDVLDKIFPYFKDKENLCSFRQVNHAWNTSAARTVKKELIWKIGPATGSEAKFMEVMSKCQDDLFRNFRWTYASKKISSLFSEKKTARNCAKIEEFLETFGSRIVELELSGADPINVERRLHSSRLPNLQRLELFQLSRETLKRTERFSGVEHFAKLKTIEFSNRKMGDGSLLLDIGLNGVICLNVIAACSSTLKSVKTDVPASVARLLAQKIPSIERLDVTSNHNSRVVLNEVAVQSLTTNYDSLKSLHVPVQMEVPEHKIYEMLSKSANHIENIHICVMELVNEDEDSDEDDEPGDDGAPDENEDEGGAEQVDIDPPENNNDNAQAHEDSPPTIPKLPRLKSAVLHNWKLHKDIEFLGKMPELKHLEIGVSRQSPLASAPPPTAHPNLTSLVFRQTSVTEETIRIIATTFPNLLEFNILVPSDEILRSVFKNMPRLKKLSLSDSKITDSGITGLTITQIQSASPDLSKEQVNQLRQINSQPFIGNLQDLQHFEYHGTSLTKSSLYFGIAWLKDLRSLVFPCYKEKASNLANGKKSCKVHPIDVTPLIEHCKYLAKLDVRYCMSVYEEVMGENETHSEHDHEPTEETDDTATPELEHEESQETENTNSGDEDNGSIDGEDAEESDEEVDCSASGDCPNCPLCTGCFTGSQITVESLTLLKKALPYLDVEYDFTH